MNFFFFNLSSTFLWGQYNQFITMGNGVRCVLQIVTFTKQCAVYTNSISYIH